jgi:hypothetical protein
VWLTRLSHPCAFLYAERRPGRNMALPQRAMLPNARASTPASLQLPPPLRSATPPFRCDARLSAVLVALAPEINERKHAATDAAAVDSPAGAISSAQTRPAPSPHSYPPSTPSHGHFPIQDRTQPRHRHAIHILTDPPSPRPPPRHPIMILTLIRAMSPPPGHGRVLPRQGGGAADRSRP